MDLLPLLGVDLGGTKIEVAALDAGGNFLLRERVPTPAGDYPATLDAIAALADGAETRLGWGGPRLPLGIGIPGSPSPRTGLIRNANSTVLNGRPLQADLAARLGREVRVLNDANCLAVSEAVDGAGAGERLVFAAILGTGVGAGIALDGTAWLGRNAVAGEWGHNPLPWAGTLDGEEAKEAPACWCGQRGCIETWLSGPAFEADHVRHGGQALRAPQIMAAMRAGDMGARASFERYANRLARALAHVINLLDPAVIVLGGGMSNVPELYGAVPRRWAAWTFSDGVDTPLRPARHGDSSGVRGAAWLWRQ